MGGEKMKLKKVLAMLCVFGMLLALCACAGGKDYAKVKSYEDFKAENWSEKELAYQLYSFDPNDMEAATGMNFAGVMNLYKDGSLWMWELPFNVLDGRPMDDSEHGISYYYYGYWTKNGDKVTVNYFANPDTILSNETLYDDGNGSGYVTVTYTEKDGALSKESIDDGVATVLVSNTQATNTAAVEYLRFHTEDKTYYASPAELFAACEAYIKHFSG